MHNDKKHPEMICCLNRPKPQQFLSSECSRGEIASYSDGTKKQSSVHVAVPVSVKLPE